MQQRLFEQFLEQRSEIFAYIRAMVRNSHDAEDVFQEVAKAVVQKSEQDEEIRNFRAWIRQVARNQIYIMVRKKSRSNMLLPSEEMLDLLDRSYINATHKSGYMNDQYDALVSCIQQLKANIAEIIRRRFVEDETYNELHHLIFPRKLPARHH